MRKRWGAVARQRGRIRRKVAAIIAASCVIGAGAATLMVTSASAVSSTDYEYYALFGTNGVQIGHDSQVHGNVGAKHNRTASPSPHEALNWAGGSDVFGEGRSGEDVAFASSTSLTGNLYYVGDLSTQS